MLPRLEKSELSPLKCWKELKKKLRIVVLQNLAEIGNPQNCHSLKCCRDEPMSVIVIAEELHLNDSAKITKAVQTN